MTWAPIPDGSDFSIDNLPIGVVEAMGRRRVATRVGDHVLAIGDVIADPMFEAPTANQFLAAGPKVWQATRDRLQEFLTRDPDSQPLLALDGVIVHLPVAVGDFVDFYSSIHHAGNVGRIFRPESEPLLPNWRHLPVGYHGRASTVVASGTSIRRPTGLCRDGDSVVRRPSEQLDFELEVGFVVGVGNEHGQPVDIEEVGEHVFGMVLVNDWSARDIQSFEYQPLGPFLGKSFATTISPWMVPLAALDNHHVEPPAQDPQPDPFLRTRGRYGLDVTVEALWNEQVVCRTNLSHLYWTYAQQFAHLTSNGASTRPGDIFATGTVSGPTDFERCCLLETGAGWLADNDSVTLKGWVESEPTTGRGRIGFGTAFGQIEPAHEEQMR